MSITTEIKPCFTINDVVKRLNVSKRTVERMIQRGDLVGFYVGKVWRMKPENLERWMEAKSKTV